jgi:hypothetical protein
MINKKMCILTSPIGSLDFRNTWWYGYEMLLEGFSYALTIMVVNLNIFNKIQI